MSYCQGKARFLKVRRCREHSCLTENDTSAAKAERIANTVCFLEGEQ